MNRPWVGAGLRPAPIVDVEIDDHPRKAGKSETNAPAKNDNYRRRAGPKASSMWKSTTTFTRYFFSIASRRALNSLPARHSGQVSPSATRRIRPARNAASSAPPSKVQSGRTSSDTLW